MRIPLYSFSDPNHVVDCISHKPYTCAQQLDSVQSSKVSESYHIQSVHAVMQTLVSLFTLNLMQVFQHISILWHSYIVLTSISSSTVFVYASLHNVSTFTFCVCCVLLTMIFVFYSIMCQEPCKERFFS